jgi:uncharacterized protein DUF7014
MSLTDRLDRFFDLFSRRQKVHGPGYNPPTISRELHGRVVLLYSEVISGRLNTRGWGYAEDHSASFFAQMHQALRLLYGRANLAHQRQRSEAEDVMAFTNECTAEQLFDFIEASFKLDVSSRIFGEENEFVAALNDIFRREGAPFQVLPGVTRQEPVQNYISIIRVAFPRVARVDEDVAHVEAVVPALSVLADPAYAGADDEFRRALQDYRAGDYADCLGKCGSAFESVLKVLAARNGITPQPGKDTAGHLIPSVLAKSTLHAGTFQEPLTLVARMRNRLSSSHGGGSAVRNVERHVAQYAVTATAAAIVLLVQDMGS